MKNIGILIAFFFTILYFFPFVFYFFPIANTKMILGVFGLIIMGYKVFKSNLPVVDVAMTRASIWAFGVSFCSLVAVVLNEKSDYTYVSYFVSMWVWLGAAYFVTSIYKSVHNEISIPIVLNYLIAVCVFQCVFAILIMQFPFFDNLQRSIVGSLGMAEVGAKTRALERVHGFSAALDFAGTRFAVIEMCICYLIYNSPYKRFRSLSLSLYAISFMIIAIVGNMISRTTIVGVLIGLSYSLYAAVFRRNREGNTKPTAYLAFIGGFAIIVAVLLYKHSQMYYDNLRFAFEGFFSLVEEGEWKSHSNDMLIDMYRWPDNIKTWLIGDGYFNNPVKTDPYYIGRLWKGFYMGSDVGYVRFIYYFGIIGLGVFSLFIIDVGNSCVKLSNRFKSMFIYAICLNFIVWLKVATDLFLFFAPFLCINKHVEEKIENRIYLS